MNKEEQLVSFGKYLLSEERTQLIKLAHPDPAELELQLKEVHDADIQNWKAKTE
jgi:hypothetical protein